MRGTTERRRLGHDYYDGPFSWSATFELEGVVRRKKAFDRSCAGDRKRRWKSGFHRRSCSVLGRLLEDLLRIRLRPRLRLRRGRPLDRVQHQLAVAGMRPAARVVSHLEVRHRAVLGGLDVAARLLGFTFGFNIRGGAPLRPGGAFIGLKSVRISGCTESSKNTQLYDSSVISKSSTPCVIGMRLVDDRHLLRRVAEEPHRRMLDAAHGDGRIPIAGAADHFRVLGPHLHP